MVSKITWTALCGLLVALVGFGQTQQVAKLTADDAEAEDYFGWSVSLDGDTAVVGAWRDDEAGADSGSAYVFERDHGGPGYWSQLAKIKADDAAAGDSFGHSVSLSGDIAIVGAYSSDDTGSDSGSAYVFERDQGGSDNWGQVAKIKADDAATGDQYGYRSVSVSGDTAVVGAWRDDDAGIDSGSAYVFERDHGGPRNWGQVAKINAEDAAAEDFFGNSVCISGDTGIVGAPGDDDGGHWTGSAYVFERDHGGAGNWGQVTKINAEDATAFDNFGVSVALSGDTAIVGAHGDDDAGGESGSAYVFERDQGGPGNWGQVAKIKADDAAAEDWFGWSIALSGDIAVVGAYLDDDAGNASGSAYVFERDQGGPGNWGQVTKINAGDAAAEDRFSSSVSVSGNTAIVGAHYDSDAGPKSGSAYVFRSAGPRLAVPPAIAAAESEAVGVDVGFTSDGQSIAATAFSVDYDRSCLDFDESDADPFDGIPDAIYVQVPGDFDVAVFHDLGDEDGEIDISIVDFNPPIATLTDGTLLTATFTATCSPALGATVVAPVVFSTDPQASFSDDLAQDVDGTTTDGSVTIYPGPRGDCNSSGNGTAADLVATGLEIFDGDGSFWVDVPGGTFLGSPVGCDANADAGVDAADVSCTILLIFGGTCGGGSRLARLTPAVLRVDGRTTFLPGKLLRIPVRFESHGHQVSSLAFSIDLEPRLLRFDPADYDRDGVPDAVRLPAPAPSFTTVRFDRRDRDGELDVLLSLDPGATFGDGVLLEIEVEPVRAGHVVKALRFSTAPEASFGGADGESVPGRTELASRSPPGNLAAGVNDTGKQ